MRRVRIFTALFLALLWVPSTGSCMLAATFPNAFGACCECEELPQKDGNAPSDDNTCIQCVTLESGVNLSALVPTVAPSPLWRDNDDFAQLLRRLMEEAAEEVADMPPLVSQWKPPPLHAVIFTKAQPVRGPSFV